jgi:uncharacterized protein YbaP (TraB family)
MKCLRTLALLATLLFVSAAPAARADVDTPRTLPAPGLFERASARNPPFFEVEGGAGAELRLLGTIHLGPKEGWTYPKRIRQSLERAETIVMEIDLRLNDEESVSQMVIEHVLLPDGKRLSKVVRPETRALIQKYDKEFLAAGLPSLAREGLYPWFVATSLTELASQRSGYQMARSADDQVMQTLGDREFIPLETIEEQFGFFDSLSLEIQDVMLRDTLERWDESTESVRQLVDAWRLGDTAELIEFSREGLDNAPELGPFFEILLDQRNEAWTARLISMLEDPARAGTEVFVAVGAFHLLGPKSVPELLEKAGYSVQGSVSR